MKYLCVKSSSYFKEGLHYEDIKKVTPYSTSEKEFIFILSENNGTLATEFTFSLKEPNNVTTSVGYDFPYFYDFFINLEEYRQNKINEILSE